MFVGTGGIRGKGDSFATRIEIPELARDPTSAAAAVAGAPPSASVLQDEGRRRRPRDAVADVGRRCLRGAAPACWSFFRRRARLLLDVAFVVAVIVCIVLKYTGRFGIVPFGFYCNDERLMQIPAEHETVSGRTLILVSILGPTLLVLINEFLIEFSACGLNWRRCLKRSGGPVAVYLLSMFYTLLVTEALKWFMSMPRPHFYHTCQPVFDELECTLNRRVTDFKCSSNASVLQVVDSQQSFPSGHASMAAGASAATIFYTLERIVPKWRSGGGSSVRRLHGALSFLSASRLAPGLICAASLAWAAICSLSRIKDNRHHWWDVLAGFLIGVVTTLLSIYSAPNGTWSRNREKRRSGCHDGSGSTASDAGAPFNHQHHGGAHHHLNAVRSRTGRLGPAGQHGDDGVGVGVGGRDRNDSCVSVFGAATTVSTDLTPSPTSEPGASRFSNGSLSARTDDGGGGGGGRTYSSGSSHGVSSSFAAGNSSSVKGWVGRWASVPSLEILGQIPEQTTSSAQRKGFPEQSN